MQETTRRWRGGEVAWAHFAVVWFHMICSLALANVSTCNSMTLPRSVPTYIHSESIGRWQAVILL